MDLACQGIPGRLVVFPDPASNRYTVQKTAQTHLSCVGVKGRGHSQSICRLARKGRQACSASFFRRRNARRRSGPLRRFADSAPGTGRFRGGFHRPTCLAAASPALVFSTISSRWNSLRAAAMRKNRCPSGRGEGTPAAQDDAFTPGMRAGGAPDRHAAALQPEMRGQSPMNSARELLSTGLEACVKPARL